MTEPTTGRRWADDGPTIISSSAHRRPIGGPSSADCRRWAIGYQLVMPSVAHRRSRRWADDGPPAACYLGRGRRIITSGSMVSSSNRPSLVILKTFSSSDSLLLIFRLLGQTRPHLSAPPPLPIKENPRSQAPNCSGEGGGGWSTTHFSTILLAGGLTISLIGTYSPTSWYQISLMYT